MLEFVLNSNNMKSQLSWAWNKKTNERNELIEKKIKNQDKQANKMKNKIEKLRYEITER